MAVNAQQTPAKRAQESRSRPTQGRGSGSGSAASSAAVSWDARLANWARWAHEPLGLGCAPSALILTSQRAAPVEQDALAVEALLVSMKQLRKPLYRVIWQCYLMRRDDLTAAEVLRIGVTEYRARLEAAWRWLEMAERRRG